MSRSAYQRMSDDGGGASSPRNGSAPSRVKSPHESAAMEKHHARRVDDEQDPQAPWLTHLEYSVDPVVWDDDEKHKACPICKAAFIVTLMGSGRHHCRMCGILCCAACSRGSLDLPGYDGTERVCEPCRKKVLQLRAFLSRHHDVLINNMHHNKSAEEFTLYQGSQPWRTEVWMSQTLMLLMWRDKDGEGYCGVPINQITQVSEGFATKELLGRRTKTLLCCISSEDEEFAAKAPRLFSVHLADGRTLDFEAKSASVRGEWVERLRGLQSTASPFVAYHMDTAHYQLHDLLRREKERLSMSNVLKQVAKNKAAERAKTKVATNKVREKYGKK